ncbi:hypothetical protein BDP27DRAFT_1317026 [Rhodocollybia butyracea]|uniref:BHLH domain-containing protein n=1 Tax=Rhodocollybia butyracea TaxID=206335 RepID=A0A9P5UCR0_9AGAR|nr:hypothetical protein BDP27DRAFT_1317026 [Rhodocollybia butyracea]
MAPTAAESPMPQPAGIPTQSQAGQIDLAAVSGDGSLTEDAAKTLSNLSQHASFGFPMPHPAPFPGMAETRTSSHPLLSQLQAAPALSPSAPKEDDGDDDDKPVDQSSAPSTGGRRGTRGGAAMGSDEWTRQRKDNHKEVERRRRGNINEGINELGRIVPNGSENEARNIEKWTLEKLLMDQAMGDLQAQLEEMRRVWGGERSHRQRAENELEALRGAKAGTKRPNEDKTTRGGRTE